MEHGRDAAMEEQEQLVLGLVLQLPLLDLLLVLQPVTTDLLATGERCLDTKSWWLVKFTDTLIFRSQQSFRDIFFVLVTSHPLKTAGSFFIKTLFLLCLKIMLLAVFPRYPYYVIYLHHIGCPLQKYCLVAFH